MDAALFRFRPSPWFSFINDGVVVLGPSVVTNSTYSTLSATGTNNGPGWNNFLSWARFESAQGRDVQINFPPGNYNFDLSTLTFPGFYAIKKLLLTGYGAVFTNTYNGSGFLLSPWLLQCAPYFTGAAWAGDGVIPAGAGQPLGFLINDTNPGDVTISLITGARTSYFSVGERVLVGSYDIQMGGLPFNMYFVDYAQIASIGSGTITFTTPLKYNHRADFNDFANLAGGGIACGAARIWKLDTTGYGNLIPTPWDVDQVFEGIQVNLPLHFTTGQSAYTTLQGMHVRTKSWKGVGLSQSTLQTSIHEHDHYWTLPEIDKNLESVTFRSCVFDFPSGAASSSVDRIIYEDCVMGGIATGAKQTLVNNCTIKNSVNGAFFLTAASQGCAGPVTFNNCSIQTWLPTGSIVSVIDGAEPLPVTTDQSNGVTYANGSIACSKTTGGAFFALFNAVPGAYVSIRPANVSLDFAGDLGVGVVIGMRSDATNVYIDTTLPYATLPSWAVTGVAATIFIFKNGQAFFNNCNGSDQARSASEACAAGYDYWNRRTYVVNGLSAVGQISGWLGELICADINVINPSAGSTDIAAFAWPSYDATTIAVDSGGSSIGINCFIKGRRVITQAMFAGKTGTDGILVGGVAASTLPSNRLVGDVAQFGMSFTPPTNFQSPLIEATFLFSTGQVRKTTTFNFNRSLTTKILATNGLLT